MSTYTNTDTNSWAQGSPKSDNKPTQETGMLAPRPLQLAAYSSPHALYDDFEAYYERKAVERKVATAKWASEVAHKKAQEHAEFMQSLPKFSRGMLIKTEGTKAYEKRIATEVRQARLKQVAAERRAAWGKPRAATNKFGHRRNGGGKGKKVQIETDEVRRVDRFGLPMGWTVATVMAKRTEQKQAAKVEVKAVHKPAPAPVVEDGLPEGWKKRVNAFGRTFYTSPNGAPQWHLPGTEAPASKLVVQPSDEDAAEREEMTALRIQLNKLADYPLIDEDSSWQVVKSTKIISTKVIQPPALIMGVQSWGAAREEEIRSQVRICGKPCNAICSGIECDRGHSCCFAHKPEEIRFDRCGCNHGEACKRFRYRKCPFYHEGRETKETYLRRIGMIEKRPVRVKVRVEEEPRPVAHKIELNPTKSVWAKPVDRKVELNPTKPKVVHKIELNPTKSVWTAPTNRGQTVQPKPAVDESKWDIGPDGMKKEPKPIVAQMKYKYKYKYKSKWDVGPNGMKKEPKPIVTEMKEAAAKKSGCGKKEDTPKPTSWARAVVTEEVVNESEESDEESDEEEYDLSLLVAHKKR